ncbi:hypothetical protein PoB_003831000 [Plakobranchus ocellatus]|uniref:Uncharacterized protein n=1 Tax=Plakobranchus ocellatus TaxID=259542 RepID=A0AAV4AYB3_9GAST|nr:hypothetical protein PoB_003831000 [Plakobranchus ocellatus]
MTADDGGQAQIHTSTEAQEASKKSENLGTPQVTTEGSVISEGSGKTKDTQRSSDKSEATTVKTTADEPVAEEIVPH